MMRTDEKVITLDEKLGSETRACPQCRLRITNPFIERCPRCFASVPRVEIDCTGCLHNIACPVKLVKRQGSETAGESRRGEYPGKVLQ